MTAMVVVVVVLAVVMMMIATVVVVVVGVRGITSSVQKHGSRGPYIASGKAA